MSNRRNWSTRPWVLVVLGAAAVALVVLGVTALGTKSSSARVSPETVRAADGVVQTTASGSGNVEPSVDEDVNFATSGTVQTVDVKVGQEVKKGQLIATLDPSSAKLTLQEAKASLLEAKDNLKSVKAGTSPGSSSSGSSAADTSATENTDEITA